ncbi:GPI inositol deacylase [Saitoella coloradoensis]
MSPSYARLTSFDTEHTRFASKYSLYLYREQGVDIDLKPNGVPVLFIPGNAGSYKQVRPIAAEAANQYAEALKLNSWIADDGKRNLDFFTVNFNEEFSAFHGQTLLDQAEYLNEAVSFILSLYHDTRQSSSDTDLPDPTSVIVIGHSMGGIVARTMLTLSNYQSNSVNTILTMSAPHAASPVPFDWDIHKIYATINDYWRKSFAEDPANNPLWQTSLISVAGGGLDTVVASDYTSTASLLPDSHGFTVFTSSVPNVWTSMDHQAILWCDQFRKVVAGALLGDRQFVAVIDQTLEPSSGFLVAEFFDKTESEILSEAGFPYFLHKDLEFTLPPKRPIVVNIRIPAIDNSLLAYTMIVEPQVCDADKQIFAPLVRQYITNPHESKFFVNVHQADINLHGDAPFMVPVIGPGIQKGLTLQFWTDPSCSTPLSVIIKLDIRGSFGKLVMRFRTVFAAFPLIIICLTLRRQFAEYDGGQAFMSFAEGLSLVVRDTLPYALVAVSISSLVLALTHSHEAMDLSSFFYHLATSSIAHEGGGGHIWRNDILLGLHNPHLWFLAPLFVLISVGTCVLLYVATMLIVNFLHLMSFIPLRKYADAPDDQKVNNQTSYFAQSTPRRRLITTLVLLFFVATFVPYQFAYIVACIVQVLTCTRALGCAKDQGNGAKGDSHWDFFNYTHSILVLMLWLLPVNIPVLVVWVRNLAVQWLTPFSSHHNVLSVAPFILLVETLTTGKMIPRTKTRYVGYCDTSIVVY